MPKPQQETEEGPMLTVSFRLVEGEAQALAALVRRARREDLAGPVRLAASASEAEAIRRALGPVAEALAKAGYGGG